MRTKKTYPSLSSCNPLDAIIVSDACAQNHAPVAKIPSRQTNATQISLPQNHIYIDNTFRACGKGSLELSIKNHGQDSSTSQLESIRFKYLGLK